MMLTSIISSCLTACAIFVCFADIARAQGSSADASLSLNSSESSILFNQEGIDALSRVLRVYELNEDIDISDITPLVQESETNSSPLPVFYFSSVVYRNSYDWKVWLNGVAYSAKFPYGVGVPRTVEGEIDDSIYVSLLSRNLIRVTWKPKEQLSQVISAWDQKDNKEISEPYQNRLSSPYQAPYFDLAEGVVTFTVRANQSFIASGFDVAEGKVELENLKPTTGIIASGFGFGDEISEGPNIRDPDIAKVVNNETPVAAIRKALSGEAGSPTEGKSQDEIQGLQKAILQSIFGQ